LKVLCERVVRTRFPDAFIPRPGLISGPWDPTGRFVLADTARSRRARARSGAA